LKRDIAGFEECYKWLTVTLGAHSAEGLDIEMWINLGEKDNEDLSRFDAIYIGGANNTYKLLDVLYHSHLQRKIIEFVKRGGNVYGGSSGGIVLGKNVATWGDDRGSFTLEDGFNLVHGFSIFCHYGDETMERLITFIEKYETPTIALPENSGFIYRENEIEVIGYSPITIFFSQIESVTLKPHQKVLFSGEKDFKTK
jgi:peptidase E